MTKTQAWLRRERLYLRYHLRKPFRLFDLPTDLGRPILLHIPTQKAWNILTRRVIFATPRERDTIMAELENGMDAQL